MTAQQAIEGALAYGTSASGTKPPASDATATEVTYSASQRSLQESDPRIAASRCVWLVTVHAPLQFHTGPPGAHFHPAPAYSVLYDVNSGFMFELVPRYGSTTSTP